MTEEEAKTKWCPKAVLVLSSHNYPSGNRFDNDTPTSRDLQTRCNCLGTDCMMWLGTTEDGSCGLVFNGSWVHVQNHH